MATPESAASGTPALPRPAALAWYRERAADLCSDLLQPVYQVVLVGDVGNQPVLPGGKEVGPPSHVVAFLLGHLCEDFPEARVVDRFRETGLRLKRGSIEFDT